MDRKVQIAERGSILVLTSWSFRDALIQAYTLPYIRIIREVLPTDAEIVLVTSEQPGLSLSPEEAAGVNLEWHEENMSLVTTPYFRMGPKKILNSFGELWKLCWIVRQKKIRTIHAFCTPAGSMGWLLANLSGLPLILDSYEPHAEAMVENHTWSSKGLAYRLLKLLEICQSRYASAFIATSAGMKDYARKKYRIEPSNFFVKPACVDLNLFQPVLNKDYSVINWEIGEEHVVCVYAGKLGGIYLQDEVFDFIKVAFEYWGERFRFLMLTNSPTKEIEAQRIRISLPNGIIIRKFVPHHDVPKYLALGDFGLNPVKPVPTKCYCTSIKDGEYWAMGLPVVITRDISDDSHIIRGAGIGYVLNELNISEYRRAVVAMDILLAQGRRQLQEKIRTLAVKYRGYSIATEIYNTIYSAR